MQTNVVLLIIRNPVYLCVYVRIYILCIVCVCVHIRMCIYTRTYIHTQKRKRENVWYLNNRVQVDCVKLNKKVLHHFANFTIVIKKLIKQYQSDIDISTLQYHISLAVAIRSSTDFQNISILTNFPLICVRWYDMIDSTI